VRDQKETLYLKNDHREQILQHLEECLPEEGCGFVGGCAGQAGVVLAVENELHSPVRFRMDPIDQLEKMIWLEDQNLEILAIFHSHPAGPEFPSPTDLAEFAYPGTITLICSKASGKWSVRGFQIEGQTYREIDLQWTDETNYHEQC
jgi:[CysO sulfur-carrier protein]-S-L-cysteine hydrolase